MGKFKITSFRGALSDYEDKGTEGAFKFGANLDVRKRKDTLTSGQALKEEGVTLQSASPSTSPSASLSPSASPSPSPSRSISPSASPSPSAPSPSASVSPSSSRSPSASASPSASTSPSSSSSPSPSPSTAPLRVFKDLIIAWVPCSVDGRLYGFGRGGKIYRRNTDGYWVQVYDQRAQITGACEKPSATGKVYLEWATRTELHRKEVPGNLSWNDVDAPGTVQGDTFPKPNLDDADYHTMAQVDGGVMICNGSKIALSAYDDSYTNEALDMIPGNIAKTIIERGGHSVIGTYKPFAPLKGVNGMIDTEIPIVQVGDDGDIYYADFTSSIATKRFPGGGHVNPGGMTNQVAQVNIFDWQQEALSWIDKQSIGNMAIMGVYDADPGMGGLYTFGRKYKNQPLTLNLEYQFDADEIGAVVSFNGTTIFSYELDGEFGVYSVDPDTKATGIYEGIDLKAPIKKTLELTKWDTVELKMSALPAGCSVQFWYRCENNGEFIQAKTVSGEDSYSTTGGKKAAFRIGAEGDIFEPRVVLVPSGNNSPEIRRIVVFFV